MLPEGFEMLSVDYERHGNNGSLDYLTVIAVDTASATRYVLHYDRPIGDDKRPSWIIRLEHAPMDELLR